MRPGCILFLAAAAFGQQSDPPAVIRSTTRLVQVRVVAEDVYGKPVGGLQRDDFRILDNRKPRPITLFSADQGASTEPAGALDRAANGVEPAGYALIVLDWLNSRYSDRVQAKELVIKMLRNYQPRQKVALFLLTHGSRLVHDFTADMPELIQAVENAGLEPSDMGDDTPGRFDARFGGPKGRVSVEEQLFFLTNRIEDTLQAFRTITAGLQRVPGRKSLIWLSAAFPIVVGPGAIPGAKPAEAVFRPAVEKIFQGLNRADVAVYSVDVRGLTVNTKGYGATLQEFAERTGGAAFLDRNDLDEGMRLALEDMRTSYILGFHVPDTATPGLHEIKVQVSRPGVHLRYRESYQLDDR